MTTPTPPSDLIAEMARVLRNSAHDNWNAGHLNFEDAEMFAQAAYAVVRERIEEAYDTGHAAGFRDGARSALKQRIDP